MIYSFNCSGNEITQLSINLEEKHRFHAPLREHSVEVSLLFTISQDGDSTSKGVFT
jgi:hypothetical protein